MSQGASGDDSLRVVGESKARHKPLADALVGKVIPLAESAERGKLVFEMRVVGYTRAAV